MVGHVLLFHPAIIKIKELIMDGRLGNIQYIYSNRLNLGQVRTHENVFWSLAPHDISIFQYFMEEYPAKIKTHGSDILQKGIQDSTITVIEYLNNVKSHIFVSWLHPFKEHRFVIIGSEGMIHFEDSIENKPLGTGGALGNCRDVVSGKFVCLNGDIISSLDMQVGIDLHEKNGGIGPLALWQVEDPTRFGIVGLDENQRVTQFKEKPKPEEVFSNLINAGSYLFEDSIFDYIPKGRSSLEREVFPVLAEKRELNGFSFDGYFIDAGTPKSWSLGVQASIANKRWKHGERVDSNWYADESIQINGESTVEHSMLSKGTSIESAQLSKCSLLDNVKIGAQSKLNGTLVGRNTTIGKNCSLDNVVVDHGSNVPDNTILSDAQWPLIE